MVGIVAYGAYVPRLRLNRQAVYDANKWFAAGLRGLAKGERSMANWDEDSITMNQMIPLGRGGLPTEAAGSVYLFCSPDSDYVSGQCLVVNGGL